MENKRCHLAESWASGPPLLPHGMPPTFAFGNKDSWGQKNRQQVPLGKFLLQAGLLNLYMFYFFYKTRYEEKVKQERNLETGELFCCFSFEEMNELNMVWLYYVNIRPIIALLGFTFFFIFWHIKDNFPTDVMIASLATFCHIFCFFSPVKKLKDVCLLWRYDFKYRHHYCV